MEELVKQMQHPQNGVAIKTHQMFMVTIPSSFCGDELISWLVNRLEIDEIGEKHFPLKESDFLEKSKQKYKEAKKVASIMCKYGYFFHVASNHTGCLREYKEFFRFQAPYFWVSTSWNASDVDYGRSLFYSHFFERRLLDPCL